MAKGSLHSLWIPNPRGGGNILPRAIGTVSIAAILAAVAWIAGQNFFTFHSLAELFSITVAAAVFVIAWNVRDTIDNGSGFDLDLLNSGEDRATGMGLFSIRERLSYLGGRMEIESPRERGSRFRLITPASAPALKESAIASPPDVSVRMASNSPGREDAAKPIRVVLVDDPVVMRQGLAGLLQTAAGIEVIGEAADGQTAVDLIRKVLPDVVLMDINMPGMDGIQATRILHHEMPDIKIIGLSMFSEGDRAAAIREAGAVDYVTKSGPSGTVIEAIRNSALSCAPCLPADADIHWPKNY